ncbi:MAG: cation diffusion facilitator family transporter [Bacteroidia bacterium]|nr:cation transporter [Bacteroidia bacterium]MCZ2277839.1 cation diffusion facilitator family transporter [Bacteroidia bacterium]
MSKAKPSLLKQKVTSLKAVLIAGVVILIVKFTAYVFTGSIAILTDALESLINIAASGFAMFSILYGARLKDKSHPYGHGKMETVAIGFEGALILLAGFFIIVKSIFGFLNENRIQRVDTGIYIMALSGIMLLVMSLKLKKKGIQLNSDVLLADAKHLMIDVLTSGILIAGLILFKLTGLIWIDSVLALILALFIIINGYKLIKKSIDVLIDKADIKLLADLAGSLEKERQDNWIDIHHMKAQKYGTYLHVDCHITMPFYLTLEEVHSEIKSLERTFNRIANHRVELSAHTDPCMQQSCRICHVKDCTFRLESFDTHITWTASNLSANKKHISLLLNQKQTKT